MGLQKCGLNPNRLLKELHPHGSIEFPCAGYESVHTVSPEDIIPWHWHEEIEIVYIKKGTLMLRVPSEILMITAGTVAIINSNIIHYAEASGYCELQSLVFSPLLLTGSINSSFATKYITPLLSCKARSSVVIFSQKTDIVKHFSTAFEALKIDAFGYEFIVREHLSHIMLILFKEYEDQLQLPTRNARQDSIRLEQMLKYIHEHYTEDITLNKISRVSAIGERECHRCFKRTIGESPIQYLLKYRLMQSAARLVSEPDVSISDIAMTCGFDSPSYYSKQFKRNYKCAPKKYRDNKLATGGMNMKNKELTIRPVKDKDIDLLTLWLNKEYIIKWYHDPDEWLTEINGRNDIYSWIHHFIVMDGNTSIGFCQYYDCYNANDMEDWYSVTQQSDTFSIDYLIGDEAYLDKGYGKAIVRLLTETIRQKEHARQIIVQPEIDNHSSNHVLRANGYIYDEHNEYYYKLLNTIPQ